MFPTFISILDIQSWWEVPSIAHFCSLFRTAFNLLDFDIEDLEEALLTDGTEETSWLQELIVRLLSGCLPNNEISTFNYQMFLRRLFRQKCQEHDRYNPFNTDIDFTLLPLKTKVDILHALCDFRLDADDVLDQLKNLEADSLRVEPLGYDTNDSAYWYFYGTRLYREDFKTKNNKKKSIWQVICFTEDDWFQLSKKFKNSGSKAERNLHHTLSKNFLPELPRLFKEKERQARRRLLENQPRRTSNRLRKTDSELDKPEEHEKKVLSPSKEDIEKRRIYERELNERRSAEIEESEVESEEGNENMARTKQRKQQQKKRRESDDSNETSKDNTSTSKTKRSKKTERADSPPKVVKPTTVGRQTNNSLSAADGQIVIQPVANSTKKKLKTSQVFRQTDEDLQVGMHKILDFVKNDEDAWPFADPVEEEYAPNYYTVIRKPMDLQKMEERLDNGYYKNFDKFKADFQLIVANCRLYNGAENEYTKMVNNLQKVFERATEKYLDQISSSEDEIAVEYLETKNETKNNKRRKSDTPPVTTRGRKPTLSAGSDKKRDKSEAKENREYSENEEGFEEEKVAKKSKKSDKTNKKEEKVKKKVETKKEKPEKEAKKSKKVKIDPKKAKIEAKKTKQKLKKSKSKKSHKKNKKQSPIRSISSDDRSRSPSIIESYRSSPPPSWPPSSPEKVDFSPKKQGKKRNSGEMNEDTLKETKKPSSKWNDLFDDKDQHSDKKFKDDYPPYLPVPTSPKPKDKHNKLRETIEKLKAKSDISRIRSDYDFDILDDLPKENKEKTKKEKEKTKNKEKNVQKPSKKETECEENETESKKSKKHQNKPADSKTASNFDALSIATEQTLKDINKWLDDTPKFAAEFSSASNSPSYGGLEDFDALTGKIEPPAVKKVEKTTSNIPKKDPSKEIKRKTFRDPSKFFKRREIQRTIDRLQPGKSKGNLIANVQNNSNKIDEIFPLGPLAKIKDTKNSLIVKTDTNAPKLSLGSVLDSFGKHKFVDDQKKEDDEKVEASKQPQTTSETVQVVKKEEKPESKTTEKESAEDVSSEGGATPNLSAWFKAFGAPKSLPPQKKPETKNEKENDNKEEKEKIVAVPDPSPSADSPQPIRQRRTSTGSSMSERSSFSQDLDSPRVGIDERAPFPYPSPSGASPRPDFSPKYPSFNGQMRVGFYQDTVSNKSSPDKNCSPRDNPPPSPYIQYGSDHVYAPNTTQNVLYSYGNSPYYSHAPNYSSTNPTPPYNMDASNPQYFDTSKSPSQLKSYPASSHSSPNSPTVVQRSPSVNSPQNSPMTAPQALESPNSPHALQIVQQPQAQNESPPKVEEKQEIQQAPMFPMKKRAYNESDPVQFNLHEYELKLKNAQQELMNRNILLGQQINIAGGEGQKEAGKPPNFDNLANFARNQPKIDMSKFTNMGYSGPEVNYSRALQQQYARAEQTQNTPQASQQSSQAFKSMVAATQAAYNATQSENISERLSQMQEATVPSGYKPEMPIPRAGYNEVDQSILGRNISNLMERFGNDERIMAGLQTTSSYYTDKGLGTSMFNKNVPIFSQANMQYGQNQQAFSAEGAKTVQAQEKKTKSKRKSSKPAPASQPAAPDQQNQPNQQQGFQSYSNLKPSVATTTIDPLKSTAAIAGSAFNFATGAASLGLEAYPNFLDEFRGAPNYYMAAAAAHHRSADGPKEARTGATGGGSQAASAGGAAAQGFGFLGATQGRSGAGYPIGAGAFMPPSQAAAQLMETGSPLYQHYLQAGVLNHQGLLAAPPAAYPPGYHLNMRQAYDSMAAAGRAPWL